jgi:hypothetical protein
MPSLHGMLDRHRPVSRVRVLAYGYLPRRETTRDLLDDAILYEVWETQLLFSTLHSHSTTSLKKTRTVLDVT